MENFKLFRSTPGINAAISACEKRSMWQMALKLLEAFLVERIYEIQKLEHLELGDHLILVNFETPTWIVVLWI